MPIVSIRLPFRSPAIITFHNLNSGCRGFQEYLILEHIIRYYCLKVIMLLVYICYANDAWCSVTPFACYLFELSEVTCFWEFWEILFRVLSLSVACYFKFSNFIWSVWFLYKLSFDIFWKLSYFVNLDFASALRR